MFYNIVSDVSKMCNMCFHVPENKLLLMFTYSYFLKLVSCGKFNIILLICDNYAFFISKYRRLVAF